MKIQSYYAQEEIKINEVSNIKDYVANQQNIGNILKITIESFTFEFTVTNVLTTNEIKCISTNVSNDAHGYFPVGTIFTKIQ